MIGKRVTERIINRMTGAMGGIWPLVMFGNMKECNAQAETGFQVEVIATASRKTLRWE